MKSRTILIIGVALYFATSIVFQCNLCSVLGGLFYAAKEKARIGSINTFLTKQGKATVMELIKAVSAITAIGI